MKSFENYLGLGIAGNFALHLDQAGEAEDFKDIITADEAAPKGMFPFYIPCEAFKLNETYPKEKLFSYPLSHDTITLPQEEVNVQAEPEVGLTCKLIYNEDGTLQTIEPLTFCAYNDCSIRVAGADKISDKKNWGKNSKGISATHFEIDKFAEGGIMDTFSICSFLVRDGEVDAYGEDVALNGYSYFYTQLTEWMTNQINTQEEFGPLEDIKNYIKKANNPQHAIISIGATRYTPYGETTFLKDGDKVVVAVYNHNKYNYEDMLTSVKTSSFDKDDVSFLVQNVEK
jgi:hypothetical protein